MLPQNPPNPPAHKGTPGRRRPNRPPATRSPASKMYASESDLPPEALFPMEMPNGDGSPFATPRKSASNSPAPQNQAQSVNARPKARNGNKPRPKSGFAAASPGPSKTNRRTPPNVVSARPPTETAFAGATFHASPAPSSLPIPSFLSKAMDSPQVKNPVPLSQQPSPPLSDSEAAPTPRQTSALEALARELARDESPLDFLLKRHKEEQAKARRESSANAPVASPPGPYSPPHTYVQSPPQPSTLPSRPPTILSRPDLLQRNSASRIPRTELDGTPGRAMGSAFSTPYAQRIRAAQTERNPSVAQQAPSQLFAHPPATGASDKAAELKKMLAIGSPPPPAPSRSGPENIHPSDITAQRLFGAPVPQPHQQAFDARPSGDPLGPGTQSPRSLDVQRMESMLRNVLKLDGGTTFRS